MDELSFEVIISNGLFLAIISKVGIRDTLMEENWSIVDDPRILLNKYNDNKMSYVPWLMLAMQHLRKKTVNQEPCDGSPQSTMKSRD